MSLDGYIAGPNDEPDNPGGDGMDRLHAWTLNPDGTWPPTGPAKQLWDDMNATGAVLAGGGPSSRSITGQATTTASRSSCPVTGRLAHRRRTIRS